MSLSAGQALLLGLVQGLTEFLPVSSSGHLVIAQALLGLEADMVTFDVFVHLGTLVAVFVAFRRDILALLRRPICRLTGLLVVGCVPAGVAGLLLDDVFTALFSSIIAVACALLITGLLLFFSDRFQGDKTLAEMSYTDALVVGLFQAAAITPGLSRSGSTIFGALLRGLNRRDAARYSFLVSIPVILGAGALEGWDLIQAQAAVEWTYFLGAAVAAASGYAAIRFFLVLLEKRSMRYFSYYVWLVGLLVLLSQLIG